MSEPLNDAAEIIDAALELLDEIQGAGYRDAHGHPIENNVAFMELAALLTARGLIGPAATRVRTPRHGDGEI